MNKIGFAFSGALVLIGIITLIKTTLINLIMPQLGRIAFQSAMAGSYSPSDYHINFLPINAVSIGLIVMGGFMAYKFYKS